MIMFLELKKQLTKIISELNKNQITLKNAGKAVWNMVLDKYNYPLRIMYETDKKELFSSSKEELINNLQSAIDYIDKNNKAVLEKRKKIKGGN